MSIASEITRLQGVKSNILQAISDKGVTVPVGSALDDCPDLIASISGGGGGGDFVLLEGSSGSYNNTTWPLNRALLHNRVCVLPIYVDIGDFVKIEIDSNFEFAVCCGSGYGQGWENPNWINGVYTFTADYNFVTVTIRKPDDSNITLNDILFAKYSVN